MKEYKLKLKYDFATSLVQLIDRSVDAMPNPDQDEQLFIAALREVQLRLKKKQVEWRPKFGLTLSPVQALALRMFYTDCLSGNDASYEANRLRMIADEIHQHYA